MRLFICAACALLIFLEVDAIYRHTKETNALLAQILEKMP